MTGFQSSYSCTYNWSDRLILHVFKCTNTAGVVHHRVRCNDGGDQVNLVVSMELEIRWLES